MTKYLNLLWASWRKNTIVRNTNMHFFRFFVDSFGWPVMLYKMFWIDSIWSPKNGPTIWLWKSNSQGHLNGIAKLVFFHPIWGDDDSKSIEKDKFINNGISKYLEFWNFDRWNVWKSDEAIYWILGSYFKVLIETNSWTKSYIVRRLLAD